MKVKYPNELDLLLGNNSPVADILYGNMIVCVLAIAFCWYVVNGLKLKETAQLYTKNALILFWVSVSIFSYNYHASKESIDSYRLIIEIKAKINSLYSYENIRYQEVDMEIAKAMEDNLISIQEWGVIRSAFLTVIERAHMQVPRDKEEQLVDAQIKAKEQLIKQYKGGEHE